MLVLSDENATVFKKFHVTNSVKAMAIGMVEMVSNLRTKYWEYLRVSKVAKEIMASRGMRRMDQYPADFLINEEGVIVDVFRAEKLQDHVPIERIEVFIPKDKRCRCNGKDCIFPVCRKAYEEIRKETISMLHMG